MATHTRFRITTAAGGSLEIFMLNRYLEEEKARGCEREHIAHVAWCEILKERGSMGSQIAGNQRTILKRVIDKIGVDKAKALFTANIQYEVIK